MITSEQSVKNGHTPVLLNEAIDQLCTNSGIFLDCTFGGGGHTTAILEKHNTNIVYATDCDILAQNRANKLNEVFGKRFIFKNINFSDINSISLPQLDGVLMDLGVSSFQLDEEKRGFSFKFHAPLDMRMDVRSEMTAEKFLETATEEELIHAIRDFGEEKYWKKVVNAIIQNRKTDNLKYTDTFAGLIKSTLPISKSKIHPATQTFQGIRIAINKELISLENTLPIVFSKLKIGGKLVVISFHSLEDRIVKKFFKTISGKAVDRHDHTPEQYKTAFAKILTSKPIIPSDKEISENPRSRSAKMRVLQKIRD